MHKFYFFFFHRFTNNRNSLCSRKSFCLFLLVVQWILKNFSLFLPVKFLFQVEIGIQNKFQSCSEKNHFRFCIFHKYYILTFFNTFLVVKNIVSKLEELKIKLITNYSDLISQEFKKDFDNGLAMILSKFPHLTNDDIENTKDKLLIELSKSFDLKEKKPLGRITFDGFVLLQFFKTFSSEIEEVLFRITEDNISISSMTPNRVCLIEILLLNNSFEFFKTGKIAINVSDLQKVLKCKNPDKSQTTLIFGEEKVFISIKSKIYKTPIKRTLEAIDFDLEENPIESLLKTEHPFEFSLKQYQFQYTIENLGIYSEIISIQFEDNCVSFSEEGSIGDNIIPWEEKDLLHFKIEKIDTEKDEQPILPKFLCDNKYALSYLKWLSFAI